MKTLKFIASFALIASILAINLPQAQAYGPSMSISGNGSNLSLSLTNAYPNSSIQLNYTILGSSLPTTITNFGTTDNNGTFFANIGSSAYGLTGGAQVYVVVNGQQSNVVSLASSGSGGTCGYSGCSLGGLTLSQTSVNLNIGQTSYVTASMPVYNPSFYISSNTNPGAVSASVSGSQISLYGLAAGSSTVSVCSNGGACASVFVTVGSGSGYGGSLSLSQTNLNVNVGQYAYITASNYGSGMYVSNNTSQSIVSVAVTGGGNQISFYGLANGSSNVTICSSSNSQCATVYVTVGDTITGGLTLSQTNVNINAGQTSYVTASMAVYNPSFYISSNTIPTVVTASVSGSQISLYGLANGSSTVTVCASAGTCGSIYVSVSGSVLGASTASVIIGDNFFSPRVTTVAQGATIVWTNNGSQSHTVTADDNSYNSGTIFSGGTFSRTFNSPGTYYYHCIFHGGNGGSGMSGQIVVTSSVGSNGLILSQNSVFLNQGQTTVVNANNYSGYSNLYVSSNSNLAVVSASASGNNLYLSGLNGGNSNVVVCANSGNCTTVNVTVAATNGNVYLSPTSMNLSVGQSGSVTATGPYNYSFYVSSNSNPYVATASFQNNLGSIYASAPGFTSIVICQTNNSKCATLNVNVNAIPYLYPISLLPYPVIGGSVLGTSIYSYSNGQLISENGTVYIVYKNTKTGFISANVFRALGFKFGNVLEVGNSGLTDSGYTVRAASAMHPWGSWIKSGSTVYFVHESGLIPVPNHNTLFSNGGDSALVVPANIYDFRVPILSVMTVGDPRLQ